MAPFEPHRHGSPPTLLDERGQPDFPSVYRALLARSTDLSVAATRIRLTGLRLTPDELTAPNSIRVLVMEVNALHLRAEADLLEVAPRSRARVAAIRRRLADGGLAVRSLPLGGWAPDFSVFHLVGGRTVALVGPHWMERPHPQRGPALTSVHRAPAADRILRRFNDLWRAGHDVRRALHRTLEDRPGFRPRPASSLPEGGGNSESG